MIRPLSFGKLNRYPRILQYCTGLGRHGRIEDSAGDPLDGLRIEEEDDLGVAIEQIEPAPSTGRLFEAPKLVE